MNKSYTMKKYFTIAGLFICLSSFAQNKDKQAIQQLLDKQVAAWNTGNIDAFMLGYWKNDSLLFMGKNGPTYGYNTTLVNYKKNQNNQCVDKIKDPNCLISDPNGKCLRCPDNFWIKDGICSQINIACKTADQLTGSHLGRHTQGGRKEVSSAVAATQSGDNAEPNFDQMLLQTRTRFNA